MHSTLLGKKYILKPKSLSHATLSMHKKNMNVKQLGWLTSIDVVQPDLEEWLLFISTMRIWLPLFDCCPLGLNLVESYPYEAVERDYDYVRLASITAGKPIDFHSNSSYFYLRKTTPCQLIIPTQLKRFLRVLLHVDHWYGGHRRTGSAPVHSTSSGRWLQGQHSKSSVFTCTETNP